MKRINHWIVLALTALAGMFFVPRAAYSLELVSTVKLPVNPIIVPRIVNDLPKSPVLPSKSVPGPFEGGKPVINFPQVPAILPTLPFPVRMAPAPVVKPQNPQPKQLPGVAVPLMPKVLASAAKSEEGINNTQLDQAYDNTRENGDGTVVVIVDRKKKERKPTRHMLPESELELEIGIIQ